MPASKKQSISKRDRASFVAQSSSSQPSYEEDKAGDLLESKSSIAPALFKHSPTTNMASALPIWEASSILTQKKDLPWKNDPNGKLCYAIDVENGEGAILFWVVKDLEREYPEALAGAAALAVIDTFDIRAACLHLIYAAHATQLSRPWEQEFVIDDRQIEEYLGLKKRTDKNRQQKLALIKEIAQQPCRVVTYISYPARPKARGFTVSESRLWNMLEIQHHYNSDLFGNEELVGLTFRVKAGYWAKYFLNEEGRTDRSAEYQSSLLSKVLLEDVMQVWQHREGAARLMVWLLFKTNDDMRYPLATRTLMEIAYGLPKVEAAKLNNRLRNKLVNAWDDDLLALHERGWQIHFHAQTYPQEIQPFAFGRTNPCRPRSFFEQLLSAQLWICPPKSLNEVLIPKTDQEITLAGHSITGVQVKKLRKKRGWSQRELAMRTGLSQSLIGRIEIDSRKITLENQEILARVFQEPIVEDERDGF